MRASGSATQGVCESPRSPCSAWCARWRAGTCPAWPGQADSPAVSPQDSRLWGLGQGLPRPWGWACLLLTLRGEAPSACHSECGRGPSEGSADGAPAGTFLWPVPCGGTRHEKTWCPLSPGQEVRHQNSGQARSWSSSRLLDTCEVRALSTRAEGQVRTLCGCESRSFSWAQPLSVSSPSPRLSLRLCLLSRPL